MPWTKEQLQAEYNLTDAEVIKTLKVCNLPVDQLEYSEIEIESTFKVVRSYFDSNRTNTYTGAADLFALEHGNQTVHNEVVQLPSGAKTSKAGKDKKSNSSIDNFVTSEGKLLITSELLALASEQCGTRISLKEAAQILDSCGLPDTDEYTNEQGDRFLEACDLIKKQGKTYEEVMAHFGVKNDSPTLPSGMQQLLELLDNSVLSADEKLFGLVNKITANQADQTDIHQLVEWSYLKNVSRQLVENNNANALFDALNQRLEDYIEGKRPAQSQSTHGDWEPISLPKSSPKPMSLPEGSDNGTSVS